jgi:hypothetical protein
MAESQVISMQGATLPARDVKGTQVDKTAAITTANREKGD